jgi:GTP-binding protein YchF
MDLLILGFPQSGKTTVFNALTNRHASTAPGGGGGATTNIGIAKVPDPRLGILADMYHPERIVPADIRYIDTPGMGGGRKRGSSLGGDVVNLMQGADALVHVVRAFDDPSVPYPPEASSPEEAATSMDLELVLIDLGVLERRAERIQAMMKGARSEERAALTHEAELLAQVRSGLEAEVPVHHQELSNELRALVGGYNLVTAKPMLVVLSLGEDRIAEAPEWEGRLAEQMAESGRRAVAMCGKLEMELAELPPEEEAEFRSSLDAGERGGDRVARASFDLLGYVSFFTVGEDEVRAWTVTRHAPAVKAAGKIHSDIERGFIRAEVVAYDDLISAGTHAEARKVGKVRLEGKEYPVKDGDIVNFLFNV